MIFPPVHHIGGGVFRCLRCKAEMPAGQEGRHRCPPSIEAAAGRRSADEVARITALCRACEHYKNGCRKIRAACRRATQTEAAWVSVTRILSGRQRRACASRMWVFEWADKATARSRPSEAAITSSVLRPMLPVEPNTAMFV